MWIGRLGQDIAVSGYAVEVRLFKAGLLTDAAGRTLNPLNHVGNPDLQSFLNQSSDNALMDKVKFFGSDIRLPSGFWPKDRDMLFMDRGETLSQTLDMAFVEALASALIAKPEVDQPTVGTRRIEGAEIAAIARNFGLM